MSNGDKRLAIMQPYFLPYIGYFQLIGAVDTFIVYDNIKFTKKGWVNRNRALLNGHDVTFSLPLKKDSDSLDVRGRELAQSFARLKLLNQFRELYRKAPYFSITWPLLEALVSFSGNNLFDYLYHSIAQISRHLRLKTNLLVSSTVSIDHSLKGQEKVLALCKAMHATEYVNAIGGRELYKADTFRAHGLELQFLKSKLFEYQQFGNAFVPWLSIIDVLMFNPLDLVEHQVLTGYSFMNSESL